MPLEIFGRAGNWSAGYDKGDDKHSLKECPFCGSLDLELCNTHTPSYWVRCEGCGAEAHGETPADYTGRIRTKKKCAELHAEAQFLAIGAWNMRGGRP